MYNDDNRKKLNRLARRVSSSGAGKKRPLGRIPTKSSSKIAKHTCGSVSHAPRPGYSKSSEFPVEFFKSAAEINAVAPFPSGGIPMLQKHIHFVTTALIQKSVRFMEQNRRGAPHLSDIESAAIGMGLEVPYGAATGELIPVRNNGRNASPGMGNKTLMIKKDKEIEIKTLLKRSTSAVIYDISLSAHWLAIEGVQPASPQNPPPGFLCKMEMISGTQTHKSIAPSQPSSAKNIDVTQSSLDEKVPGGHASRTRYVEALHVERFPQEVSQELMGYFRELTEACVGANESRRKDALENAATDTGLQPLVPFLVNYIKEGVRMNSVHSNLAILIYLVRLTKALVDNPNVCLKPYLHDLVPSIITCSLCRQVCAKPATDNHWALRDFAAKQLVAICNKYNTSSNGLYSRITQEIYRALWVWIDGKSTGGVSENLISSNNDDPEHSSVTSVPSAATPSFSPDSTRKTHLGSAVDSLNTVYGALTCFNEFGINCLRKLVFPLLPALCKRITSMVASASNTSTVSNTSATTNSSSASSNAEVVLMLDQETGFRQTMSAAPTTSLPVAELKAFETVKNYMKAKFTTHLADWRLRQGHTMTIEAYKADYGIIATSLLPANLSGAGGLILTKPQA
ncbi:hypothetical protein Aperf_G00000019532 [Anoplocephala perfoliata]